ncbi:response regulator transcription factor [Streptosporangium saharense]|uniref:response regulator transcription factor n=1 Tax=Streptosporangium saharense TaxID=1706840 RepID=UPI003325167D
MIRVLIAEDVNMIRGALVALLELEEDLTVVAEVGDGDRIVPEAVRHRPDVALIDVGLPGLDGISAATRLRETLPGCRTLILTGLGRPGTLHRAIEAKVFGYVLKDAPPEELAHAVRAVADGQHVFDPKLALAAWNDGANPLTLREAEVLRLAGSGAGAREIAACLSLSPGTVRNYLTAIVAKLNARNLIDALRLAQESGWLS